MRVSEEIRHYAVAPRVEEEIASLPNAPTWLPVVLRLHHAHPPPAHTRRTESSPSDVYTKQAEGCPMIKYGTVGTPGRFGPSELPIFCSALPEYFPKKAGHAYRVLPHQLEEYEKTLVKIAKARLPDITDLVGPQAIALEKSPAAEEKAVEDVVHFKSPPASLSSMFSFRSRNDRQTNELLSRSLRKDIGLYLLSERSYLATRRNELTSLPGMQPHYPNPNYHPARAAVEPFKHAHPSKGFMHLFSKSVDRNISNDNASQHDPNAASSSLSAATAISSRSSPRHRGRDRGKDSAADSKKTHSFVRLLQPVGRQPFVAFSNEQQQQQQQQDDESKETTDADVKNRRKKPKQPSMLDFMLSHRRGSFPNTPGLELFAEGTKGSVTNKVKKVDKSTKEVTVPKACPTSGFIQCFRANGGTVIVHQGTINDAVFSPSEKRLASAGGGNGAIRIWDPRDGTFVRELPTKEDRENGKCHVGEVLSLAYSRDELYLVSAGADSQILVWDMMTNRVTRWLRGHADMVSSISISPDCSMIVSASADCSLKTWVLTPRKPDPPDPPRIISKTDTTMLITWTAPPSYNETVTAFFLQYRIGVNREWKPNNSREAEPEAEAEAEVAPTSAEDICVSPKSTKSRRSGKLAPLQSQSQSENSLAPVSPGISIPPQLRSRVVQGLSAATPYQFRLRAVNRMGVGDWGSPSLLVSELC